METNEANSEKENIETRSELENEIENKLFGAAKASCDRLERSIDNFNKVIAEPDKFIDEYFDTISAHMSQRQAHIENKIKNYYNDMQKDLERFRQQCKSFTGEMDALAIASIKAEYLIKWRECMNEMITESRSNPSVDIDVNFYAGIILKADNEANIIEQYLTKLKKSILLFKKVQFDVKEVDKFIDVRYFGKLKLTDEKVILSYFYIFLKYFIIL
jgi:hypothetical protein